MCDVKKYSEIYNEIKALSREDTQQLIVEASIDEEKDFYALVGDFFLQKKQDDCIARNVF